MNGPRSRREVLSALALMTTGCMGTEVDRNSTSKTPPEDTNISSTSSDSTFDPATPTPDPDEETPEDTWTPREQESQIRLKLTVINELATPQPVKVRVREGQARKCFYEGEDGDQSECDFVDPHANVPRLVTYTTWDVPAQDSQSETWERYRGWIPYYDFETIAENRESEISCYDSWLKSKLDNPEKAEYWFDSGGVAEISVIATVQETETNMAADIM